MQLGFAQNKTLAENPANGVAVHLFEVQRKGKYTYVGEVERINEPYQATQPDADGKERLAWLFPLQLKSHQLPLVDGETAQESYRRLRSCPMKS